MGFTLIETAFVVIILSFVITPLYIFLNQQREKDRIQQEEAVQEQILASMALFLKQNARYPCPATPTLAPGDPNFGRENCTGGTIMTGTLPVTAMNLPFRRAANRDSWQYIYAVTSDLTNAATFDNIGEITINDTEDVHFVIVNPGVDGKGTKNLLSSGALNPCSGPADDEENCNNNDTFLEADIQTNGGPADPGYYDDKLIYTQSMSESSFWLVRQGPQGGLSISNRNEGNIGIGTNNPTQRLEVQGGNMRIEGGNVQVRKDISAGTNIRAEDSVRADETVKSPAFTLCTTAPCP